MEDTLFTLQLYTPGSDISIGFRSSQIIWGRTGNDVLLGYQPTVPHPNSTQIDLLIGDLAIEDPTFRQWQDTYVLGDWVRPYYTNNQINSLGLEDLVSLLTSLAELDLAPLYEAIATLAATPDNVPALLNSLAELDLTPLYGAIASLFPTPSNTHANCNEPIPDITDLLGFNDLALIPDFTPGLDSLQLHGTAESYQLFETPLGTLLFFVSGFQFDAIAFLLGVTGLSLSDRAFQFQGSSPPPDPALPQTQQLGTTEYDIPLSIATDPSGDVYVAGGTNGSLVGASEGLRDAFVTKYDSDGNVLFLQQFGTSGFETIYGIDTDNQGNYYVAGVTDGELGGSRQAESLDTFVAKYDSDGNQLWIRQIGENVIFNAFNLAVDQGTGDVFISGADVGDSLEDDTFVIKFDTNGNQQWSTRTGTQGFLIFDESYGLTVSQSGSVYATGWTSGDLGGVNAGLYDNWLAKYDNDTGETEWIVQYGTPDYEWSWDVRTDSAENVYTTGWTLGNLGGDNAGSFDAYLSKFDSQGNLLWINQFGGEGDDEAYSLYIDGSDNLFVGGYTDGDLGGSNAGSFDAWVAKFDAEGNQVWITQFGTGDRDELYGLAADDRGNLYATGITKGSMGAVNAGSFDGWTAKLDALSGELQDFSGESTGDEALRGTRGADTLNGRDGNDRIFGKGGKDTLLGGTGNDKIYGGSKADTIFGGSGDDTIYGKGGEDWIDGGSGSDRIFLGSGAATVVLNQGIGHDMIKKFRFGSTQLKVSSLDDLSFAGNRRNVKIFQDNDLLAMVKGQSVHTFRNNIDAIFVV